MAQCIEAYKVLTTSLRDIAPCIASGILSISKGDFPHVLEEDISIPGLSNPQLPNSVPWAALETQETRIVSSDLEGQKFIEPPQYLTHEEGAFWNSWNTYQPLQSQTASEASFLSPPVAAQEGTSYASQRKPANLSAKVEGCYKKFSHEDMRKLIKGVKRFGRGRWKDIKKNYFQYSKRTNNELKEKWRHMLKSVQKAKDPSLQRIYIQAAEVEVSDRKPSKMQDKLRKFLETSRIEIFT